MAAAAISPEFARTSPYLVVLALAVAIVAGIALSQRGPDLAYMPEMASDAFVMPDGRALYAQRFEVTVSEWNACAVEGACDVALRARAGRDPSKTPATGLNFIDVQQYLSWINQKTRHGFRLPTAAEWNAMAEAVLPQAPDPLFTDPSLSWASSYLIEGLAPRALKPQGSFSTSPEGIADLDGSVWEWTMECYDAAYGGGAEHCPAYFVGGEHIAAMSYLIRDPARGGCAVGTPPAHLGLRLVSDARPVSPR